MFRITFLDHVRMTFGQVIHRHKAHLQGAERLTRRLWQLRMTELTLLAGTVTASVAAAVPGGGAAATLAAVLASLAFLTYVLLLAFRLESRIYAHRWCGARLWLIREKYYALLVELSEGLIETGAAQARRDTLMKELHAVYEHAPLIDRAAYQSARDALTAGNETVLSDEELDRFLPESLRKTTNSPSAS